MPADPVKLASSGPPRRVLKIPVRALHPKSPWQYSNLKQQKDRQFEVQASSSSDAGRRSAIVTSFFPADGSTAL
jgi:hypothetical protein